MQTITYLALADGRGHLMRAHLLSELLRTQDIHVQLVTTRPEGARFLHELGHEAVHILPGGLHIPYRGPDLDHRRADREIGSYLANPRRYLRDIRVLARLTRDSSLVVNDSFHPAATWLALGRRRRVAFVHAEHVRTVTFSRLKAPLRALLLRALTICPSIEASLDPARSESSGTALLPLFAAPRPTAHSSQPKATVYLNPNLDDDDRGHLLRHTLERRGFVVEGVGPEAAGFARNDARLVDKIAASSMIVGAPGAATCSQALAFGIPLLALLGDQPEQRANVLALERRGHPVFPIDVHGDLERAVDVAARVAAWIPQAQTLSRRRQAALAIQRAWTLELLALLGETTDELQIVDDRARTRDPQPAIAL